MRIVFKCLLGLLSFCTIVALAAEEACPPAAEVAELQNPTRYQHCDYSNEGLNGMLHRAFAKKKEESSNSSQEAKKELDKPQETVKEGNHKELSGKFSSAAELAQLRAALIVDALKFCTGRLEIRSETYLKSSEGLNELVLATKCINKP